jgi:hypothetical protein
MKRLILPLIGILAAVWAAYSVVRAQPRRERTDPPAPPAVSDFTHTVAAVGLIEASTENISVGTPLAGVVVRVLVTLLGGVARNSTHFCVAHSGSSRFSVRPCDRSKKRSRSPERGLTPVSTRRSMSSGRKASSPPRSADSRNSNVRQGAASIGSASSLAGT